MLSQLPLKTNNRIHNLLLHNYNKKQERSCNNKCVIDLHHYFPNFAHHFICFFNLSSVKTLPMKDLIGYIAAIFTTFSMLPQIVRILKLKEARDISVFMPLMASTGSILWLFYGIMLNEMPIIAANAIALLFSLTVLFITIKYR
jgi:MtN3 and saliva related transmembrane protein